MSNLVLFLFIFLLLLVIEGTFNYLAGLWSIFWVPLEIVFDLLFLGFIGFLTLASSTANKQEVRE